MKIKHIYIGYLPKEIGRCHSVSARAFIRLLYLIPISLYYALIATWQMCQKHPLFRTRSSVVIEFVFLGIFYAVMSVAVTVIHAAFDTLSGRLMTVEIR